MPETTLIYVLKWFFASLLKLTGGMDFWMVDKQLLLILGYIPLRVSVIITTEQTKGLSSYKALLPTWSPKDVPHGKVEIGKTHVSFSLLLPSKSHKQQGAGTRSGGRVLTYE